MREFGPGVSIEVKNLDEAGYIEGLASSFGNIDYGNDRVIPGAFAKSLSRKPSVPMLLYHDMKRPVGKWAKATETELGLKVEGKISTKTREGGEAYELVKDEVIGALSIGYDPVVKRMAGKVRELVEIDLHEVSLVTIGMDPHAGITGVKSSDVFARWLAGDRPQQRELEMILKDAFNVSNSEAERMANALLKDDRGGRDDADPLAQLWASMA
jgi:HK97 family phage prohead protease